MNEINNTIFTIEDQYDVEKLYFKNNKVWPILRMNYSFGLIKKTVVRNRNKVSPKKVFKDALYGILSWFGRYEYIVFSDPGKRVKIDDKMFNISFDTVADTLNQSKTLFLDRPNPNHLPIGDIYSENIVSTRMLDFCSLVIRKIFFRKCNIQNVSILDVINKDLDMTINYCELIKRFYSDVVIYKLLLKLYRPKAIFVTCYYCAMPLIKAAKLLHIPVIEAQHGLIGENHPAYNSKYSYKDIIPDYILTYGETDSRVLKKSIFFKEAHSFSVGHFYLDYLVQSFKTDMNLVELKKDYDICIGVSLQWTITEPLITFISEVAKIQEKILFVLIPRKGEKFEFNQSLENIIVYNQNDCYSILQHMDFHTTVYSTCALEAPSLGIRNILININNEANKHFDKRLSSLHTKIVDTSEEYMEAIHLFEKQEISKKEIIQNNKNNYMPNFNLNIDNFLRNYIKG